MDITVFIRELLFGHDCVIVPGFGGFIGNYTPARIDKNTATLYPPVKQISFNRNLNHNDGLLIGRISGATNINYGDARNLVEEFVSGIRKKLEKGEKVVFDNIGSFVKNQEGNIQFEPDKNVNYHLDSFGLESFQYLPLEGYDVRKRILKHTAKDPVRQTTLRKVLWRAAVIVPLILVGVAIPLKTDLFKSRIESTTLNPLVTAEFENNKKAVDEDNNLEALKAVEAVNAVSETVSTPEINIPAIVEETGFFVITGSFKSEENALFQAGKLKDEGFIPEIVAAPNGFYRVSAKKCSDMATAKFTKDSISKKFPGSWISKRR